MSQNTEEVRSRKPPISSSSWTFTDDPTTMKYDHAWSITNFHRKMSMEPGQMLKSGTFSVSFKGKPTDWYLEIYPNGKSEVDRGYVSLFLRKANASEPVEVEAFFYTVTQEGVRKSNRNLGRFQFLYKNMMQGFGYAQFVNHASISLPNNDKTLTILCEMCLLGDVVVHSGTSESNLPRVFNTEPCKSYQLLPHQISSFYESGEYSDCVVSCGDTDFKCHKIVLASRSPVFKAMFSSDLKESISSRVVIEDLDVDIVTEMIHYMYSGNVRQLDDQAISLLTVADKYDLSELKETCESHLCEKITMANICDILIVSYLHNGASLPKAAFQYVSNNGDKLMEQNDFKDKLMSYPHIIMRILELCIKK